MAANLHALQGFQAEQFQTLLERTAGQSGQTQTALLLFGGFGGEDRAVLVEAGEQACDVVQVAAQHMWGALLGDIVEYFTELRQASGQILLMGRLQDDVALDFLEALAQLAEYAGHSGVGIQQVGCGVAVEVEHQLEVEAVVAGAVLGQVGVLHRADPDHFTNVAQFVFGQARILVLDQCVGTLLGLGQQVDQFYGAAVTCLERAAVSAVHGAEAHVFHLHWVADEACAARDFEHLVEVQGLALVDEVQGTVGLEDVAAIADGRQVGGGIEVAAIGLLHDHRQRLAFGILEFIEEHALGALILDQQALGLEVGDHVGQVAVVGAFAHHVGHGQLDVEQLVGLLAVGQGDVLEAGPQGHALRVAGLQLDHQATGAGGEFLGLVEALFAAR